MASFGIALAAGLATNFLISLLTPSQEQSSKPRDVNGPRLNFDQPIPRIYGRTRVGGGYLWAPKVKVREETESSGGKGGGSKQKQTTYTYFADFAIWFAQGPCTIKRIWANGNIIWAFNGESNVSATLYSGEETQAPSSLIQEVEGVDKTPAFRGLCYVVFEDLDLEPFGNSFPQQVEAEIEADDLPAPSVGEVVEDICLSQGLEVGQIDASDIADIPLTGVAWKRNGSTAREFLEELQQLYFFLPILEGEKIKFVKQTRPLVHSLEFTDLSPSGYTQKVAQRRELPYEIQVSYLNQEDSFLRGVQYSRREGRRENENRLESDAALTDSKAKQISEQLLRQYWIQRRTFEDIELLPAFLGLTVGDVIELPVQDGSQFIQVRKLDIGANLEIELEANLYEGNTLSISEDTPSSEGDYEYRPPQSPATFGQASLKVFEAPLRGNSDAEVGVHAAVEAPASWLEGGIYYSEDGNNYALAQRIGGRSVFGVANNDISSSLLPNAWDGGEILDNSSTLSVTLTQGSLSSIPQSAFDNDQLMLLVGDEYIVPRDVNLVGENEYELSYLKRGKRGTESAIAQHSSGELVSLARGEKSSNTYRIQGRVEDIGKNLTFKAVYPGQAPEEVDTSTSLTVQGISLKPFAPVNLIGQKDGDDNIIISWEARSRGEFSRGEEQEKYEIDILDDSGTVVRTLEATSQSVIYRVADQETDFGSPVSQLDILVYKISSIVGRGFPASAQPLPEDSTVLEVGTWFPDGEEFRGKLTFTESAIATDNHRGFFLAFNGDTQSTFEYDLSGIVAPGHHSYLYNAGASKTLTLVGANEILGGAEIPTETIALLVHRGKGEWLLKKGANRLSTLIDVSDEPPVDNYLLFYNGSEGEWEPREPSFEDLVGTTDQVPEGDDNLYYTNARVDTRLDQLGLNAIGNFKDTGSDSPSDDYVVAWDEGRGLYIPQPLGNLGVLLGDLSDTNFPSISNREDKWVVQWDANNNQFVLEEVGLDSTSTDQLPEGNNNLYYTNSRVGNYISNSVNLNDLRDTNTSGVGDRSILIYDGNTTSTQKWKVETLNEIAINNTDDVPEGDDNLYYTDSRFDSRFNTRFGQQGLGDLNNVDDSGIETGDALIYDGSNYVPGNPNQGIDLEDLGNVSNTLNPSTDDVLAWGGSSSGWIAKNLLETFSLSDLSNVSGSGSSNHFLTGDGSDNWSSQQLFFNKGDIVIGTGSSGFTNLEVGANGRILIADNNQSAGVRWGNPLPAFINIQTISTNYSVQEQDHNSLIRINDNADITLPTNVTPGFFLFIRMDASGVESNFTTSGVIDGISKLDIAGQQVRAIFEGGSDNVWFITQIEVGGVGDITTDNVVEEGNKYYTDARVDTRISELTVDQFNEIEFTNLAEDDVLIRDANNTWINTPFSNLFTTQLEGSDLSQLATKNFTDLDDVATPQDGFILQWDNTNSQIIFVDFAVEFAQNLENSNLSQINDVASTSPDDGDVLTWSGSNNRWQPQSSSDSGGGGETSLINIWLFGGI